MARRQRSHYDKPPWWKFSVGGAPVWLLIVVGVFVVGIVIPAVVFR